MANLASMPLEILQEITIQTTTDSISPPSTVVSLLRLSKSFNNHLSFSSNPAVWGAIFENTFDTSALYRRFPAHRLTSSRRAEELKRRWISLKRIKANSTGLAQRQVLIWGYPDAAGQYHARHKVEDAWLAYMMFTESDGRNSQILLQWANIVGWIHSFVFYDLEYTAVHSQRTLTMPAHSELRSLGLWLYWFIMQYSRSFFLSDSISH